jgi:hypothetical protein
VTEPKVFRPRRSRGIFVLIAGSFFSAFGLCGMIAIGWESWYFYGLFMAWGGFIAALGWVVLCRRVLVDARGITRTFWFGNVETRIPWEAIESWLVSPCGVTGEQEEEAWAKLYPGTTRGIRPVLLDGDSFTFQAAMFRVQGERWPITVYDVEVWRPSFDAFLEDIRAHIGEKEIVIPRPQNSTKKASEAEGSAACESGGS